MEGKAHRLLGDSRLSSVIKGFSPPWCLSKAHAVLRFPSLLAKWGVPRWQSGVVCLFVNIIKPGCFLIQNQFSLGAGFSTVKSMFLMGREE